MSSSVDADVQRDKLGLSDSVPTTEEAEGQVCHLHIGDSRSRDPEGTAAPRPPPGSGNVQCSHSFCAARGRRTGPNPKPQHICDPGRRGPNLRPVTL